MSYRLLVTATAQIYYTDLCASDMFIAMYRSLRTLLWTFKDAQTTFRPDVYHHDAKTDNSGHKLSRESVSLLFVTLSVNWKRPWH